MTITNPINASNITFESSANNLLITNDLTTGNILFTSERHNTQPQVLGTLVAEADPRSTDEQPRVRIKRMKGDGSVDRVLIRRKNVWRFFCEQDGSQGPTRISTDADGPTQLAAVLNYLNNLFTEIPSTTSTILKFGPDDTLDAARDATNTTVLFDNGKEHAVNAILAVENSIGLINVVDHATQQIHFRDVRHDKVTITGSSAGSNVTSVINALNALFTVNPLGAGYTPTQILPTLAGEQVNLNLADELVPATTDPQTGGQHIIAASGVGDGTHHSRAWTNEFIDVPGEFFDFRITGEGKFLLGAYQVGVDEPALAEGTTGDLDTGAYWAVSINDFGDYLAPQAVFGSASNVVYGSGWNGAITSQYQTNTEIQSNHENGFSVLWRLSIDNAGYLSLFYYDANRTNDFVLVARKASVHQSGVQLGLLIKLVNGNATLVDVPKRTATDPTGPALAYRYIESPDGSFYYPLFASADEAAYVDIQNGGALPGSAHAHTFIDEPTGSIWYMPTNGGTHAGPSAPTNSTGVVYTEIPTEDDALHVPPAFSQLAGVTAPENTSGMNINLYTSGNYPSLGNYTTTISPASPFGLVESGGYLQGTLPYVSADTTEIVTVTRTNTFGSSTGTFTITIENRPELSAIAGWTVHQGNTVSPDTIKSDEHSVLEYNTQITPGTRVRIPFQRFMKFGIPNATGISNKETVDIFSTSNDQDNFNLLFTVWTDGAVNQSAHAGIGWTDNSVNNQFGHSNDDLYFLDYKSDGNIWVTNSDSGEVLLQSATTYSGPLSLYFGTPSSYTQDSTIPSVTLEALAFTGDAINGFTKDNGGENLIDASTLADGSVVSLDQAVANNHRLVIRKEWIETHVMSGLQNATGTSQFFIGIPSNVADFGATGTGNGPIAAEDFQLAAGFSTTDDIRGTSWNLKLYKNGAQVHSIGVGGTGTNAIYDIVFSNVDGRWELSLQNNFGSPVPTDAAVALRQVNGGTWSQTVVDNSFSSGAETIYFGTQNTTGTLSLTGLEFHREPFLPRDILVGEFNNGHSRFALQPSATKFDEHSNGHAWPGADYVHPTVVAGQTYRYIYHPSMEADDDFKVVRASDGSDYGTLTPFGSGDPSFTSDYKGFTFTVPADAPPLRIAYKNGNGGNTNYGYIVDLPVSGSTYQEVNNPNANVVGPTGNHEGDLVTGDYAWVELDIVLNPGERLIVPPAFHQQLRNAIIPYTNYQGGYWIGLASPANYDVEATGSAAEQANFFSGYFVSTFRLSNGLFQSQLIANGVTQAALNTTGVQYANMNYAFDLTGSGENHRVMLDYATGSNPAIEPYSSWNATRKMQTGATGTSHSNLKVILKVVANGNNDDIDLSTVDFSLITKQAIPTPPPATLTPWTKAIDFSGSSERLLQVSNSNSYNPIMMHGVSTTVPLPTTSGNTSAGTNSKPWACAMVFKPDYNTSNQHIWNVGEGSGTEDDNIYVRLGNNSLYFGWGRSGEVNECYLGSIFWPVQNGEWIGLYIGHTGARFNASDATVSNLMNAFDIRLFGQTTTYYSGNPGIWTPGSNISNQWGSNLSQTGARMDRTVAGNTTIGGRGANRSFHGKVASMVITTLRVDQPMPDTTEIHKMVTDPKQWLLDYKVGQPYRRPYNTNELTFQLDNAMSGYGTQVWLMGDGPNDAYAQIRNDVDPTNQSNTPMNMVSMVANDIETINIPNLS